MYVRYLTALLSFPFYTMYIQACTFLELFFYTLGKFIFDNDVEEKYTNVTIS